MGRVAPCRAPGNRQADQAGQDNSKSVSGLSAGCPCGGGAHPPDSHLWTVEHLAAAAQRSVRQVYRDRTDNPDNPLHAKGAGRGSARLVYSFAEAQAYLAWITGRGV